MSDLACHTIPRRLDDPERWLFWTVDEAAALMGPALLGLAANQFVPGLVAEAVVIDDGRSFQHTAEALGGAFIAFGKDPACLNPFAMIDAETAAHDGDYREECFAMLAGVIGRMARRRGGIDDIEAVLIAEAIAAAWDEAGNAADLGTVRKHLEARSDRRAADMATSLGPWCPGGAMGRLFAGSAVPDLGNAMTVFELAELKGRGDVQAVVLMLVVFLATQRMYHGPRTRAKAIVIDEAWDLLSGEDSRAFLEGAARRARKYRGALVTGTQSVNDYYANPAARAAWENSDWVIFLAQKDESVELLKAEKRIHCDPGMERALKSLTTADGRYAELVLHGPDGWRVARLVLDAWSVALFSSRGPAFAAVENLKARGLTTVQAIDRIAGDASPGDDARLADGARLAGGGPAGGGARCGARRGACGTAAFRRAHDAGGRAPRPVRARRTCAQFRSGRDRLPAVETPHPPDRAGQGGGGLARPLPGARRGPGRGREWRCRFERRSGGRHGRRSGEGTGGCASGLIFQGAPTPDRRPGHGRRGRGRRNRQSRRRTGRPGQDARARRAAACTDRAGRHPAGPPFPARGPRRFPRQPLRGDRPAAARAHPRAGARPARPALARPEGTAGRAGGRPEGPGGAAMTRAAAALLAAMVATLAVAGISSGASAKDLGVRGATWPVAEPDLLAGIEARLEEMQRSGALARLQEEARARARQKLEEPDPVPGIVPARSERTRLFDPAVTVERDIRTPDGALIAAAGTRVDPLERVALGGKLARAQRVVSGDGVGIGHGRAPEWLGCGAVAASGRRPSPGPGIALLMMFRGTRRAHRAGSRLRAGACRQARYRPDGSSGPPAVAG